MRLAIIFTIIALFAPLRAAEIDELVPKLGDQDFDAREKAQVELGKYPASYANIFMKLAQAYEKSDAEVAWRLRKVARAIYDAKILPADSRYKRLVADVPFEGEVVQDHWYQGEPNPDQAGPHNHQGGTGVMVKDEKDCGLKKYDLIVKIDGKTVHSLIQENDFGIFEAGKEHEFVVRRFKDTAAIDNNGGYLTPNDENEEVTVKVKVGELKELPDDKVEAHERLRSCGWKEWSDKYHDWDKTR